MQISKRFILIIGILLLFITKGVLANALESSQSVHEISTQVQFATNAMFDEFFDETLVFIIPDESGNFILESFGDYTKREKKENRERIYNDLPKRLEELKKWGSYKRILFRVGEKVSYKYLFEEYLSSVYKMHKSDGPVEINYVFLSPIRKSFDIKKEFLPLSE